MSFVPVTGPATFRPADPPRDGTIEFTDERRTIACRSEPRCRCSAGRGPRPTSIPSVALLGGAALLAGRFVAAGKLAPTAGRPAAVLADRRARRARPGQRRQLARARAYDDLDPAAAATLVAQVLDAVADALPRAAPVIGGTAPERTRPSPAPTPTSRTGSAAGRPSAPRPSSRAARRCPELVRISLRVEADEEELVGGLGARRAPGPRRARPAPRLRRRAALDGRRRRPRLRRPRARVHASIALRAAAEVWPVLDRLLELSVPDQLTLDGDEMVSLLEDGVGALRDAAGRRARGRAASVATSRRGAVLDRRADPREPSCRSRTARSRPTRCSPSTGRSRCTASRSPTRRWTQLARRRVADPQAPRRLDRRRPGDRPQARASG